MPLPYSDVRAFQRDPLTLLLERAQSTEPGFVPLYLGLRPIWLATSPKLARQVLTWQTDEIDKGRLVQTLRPLLDSSLLTNIGADHHRTKTAIHRHVRRAPVEKNLTRLTATMNNFVARLATNTHFNTRKELAPLALQLTSTVLFGHDVISAADRMALVEAVQIVEAEIAADMFRLPIIPRAPWTAKKRANRLSYARKIVSFVVGRARKNDNRSDILRGLEQAGLSDAEIETEMLGLLVAGHHTTGASFGWLLYHFAIDPEIADMIALEADEILQAIERNEPNALKTAALSEAYVHEILRLYPAGWWTSREVLKPVNIQGKDFAIGDTIMVSPWQLHRDPRFWFDPDKLNLERSFRDENYMPFGIGPRACIGMSIGFVELQLLTLQLASAFRFDYEVMKNRPKNVKPHPSVTLLFPPVDMIATPRTEMQFRQQVA